MSNLKTTIKRRLLLASMFACMFAGCGDSNRSKIIGTWGIEQADTVMSRIVSEEDGNSQINAVEPEPPKMLLMFHRNGRLETATRMGDLSQEKTGQWEMISFDESTNSMTIACELQMQKSDYVVTFFDQDTIKLIPPNMAGTKMKLKFKRQ